MNTTKRTNIAFIPNGLNSEVEAKMTPLVAAVIVLAVATGVVIAARHFLKSIEHQPKKKSKPGSFEVAKKTFLEELSQSDPEEEEEQDVSEGTPNSTQRLEAVNRILEGLKATYPDAKKLKVDVDFEFQEDPAGSDESELCPEVHIEIER